MMRFQWNEREVAGKANQHGLLQHAATSLALT